MLDHRSDVTNALLCPQLARTTQAEAVDCLVPPAAVALVAPPPLAPTTPVLPVLREGGSLGHRTL